MLQYVRKRPQFTQNGIRPERPPDGGGIFECIVGGAWVLLDEVGLGEPELRPSRVAFGVQFRQSLSRPFKVWDGLFGLMPAQVVFTLEHGLIRECVWGFATFCCTVQVRAGAAMVAHRQQRAGRAEFGRAGDDGVANGFGELDCLFEVVHGLEPLASGIGQKPGVMLK